MRKFENHCHAVALYSVWYNFCRVHKTLGVTPAMAAGVVEMVMKMRMKSARPASSGLLITALLFGPTLFSPTQNLLQC